MAASSKLTAVFLSTPSARRATRAALLSPRRGSNFYPRPPRGGRLLIGQAQLTPQILFLSTPSARRATGPTPHRARSSRYFYPRPPRGGRPFDLRGLSKMVDISIHALREEGDRPSRGAGSRRCNFYPRPPRGGRPSLVSVLTLPHEISIHALREEGDALDVADVVFLLRISIHALREEGDRPCLSEADSHRSFLSTPSARRATELRDAPAANAGISIHALREEGDPPHVAAADFS